MGKKALLGTFASVLAGIFFAVSRQGLGFYFAIAAVEGALTLGISYLVQKGVVLLLDDRFARSEYTRLFPRHWGHLKYLQNTQALSEALDAFWKQP